MKILKYLLLFIICLFLFVVIGVNILKYPYYHSYYSILTKLGKNPGLNEGFVPQGITFFNNHFITTGYMGTKDNSRIYTINCDSGKISYFPLICNGQDFKGHTGGIQYLNGKLYLANENTGIYEIDSSLVFQKSGTVIDIKSPIPVNNNSSFIFGKGDFLYVGEFCNKKYPCKNFISYNKTKNSAIVSKYHISDFSKPVEVFSVPNQVQGFGIKEDGTIVLSTSYSLNSSYFYIYAPEKITKTNQTFDSAPVYFLAEPSKIIKAPAQSEDIDIIQKNGKEMFITLFESSCNKYIFGKFFFSNYIAGLEF